MSMQALLIELLTEELPPKALATMGSAFATSLVAGLAKRGLVSADAKHEAFATPRRLAVRIENVNAKAADQPKREKVLPVSVAIGADGKPTQALAKKLAALNAADVALAQLERAGDGKQESFFYNFIAPGLDLASGLQEALTETVEKLPIPKVMRYQTPDGVLVQFVRPAHRLVALHGASVVSVQVLGLTAGRETLGHRFLSNGLISVNSADTYAQQLSQQGSVVPGFNQRRETIRDALVAAAQLKGARLAESEALLDEVTALVEFPVVYAGQFDAAFLAVPQECLILSMKQHQKYFPLVDQSGKLLPQFLIVSNLKTDDPVNIVRGNERVLRARLSDAKFFFDQDRKTPLAGRLEKLGAVVFHNKLGSQLQRVQRFTKLAGEIAGLLKADVAKAERAAHLAKADLVTDMVGEFPELQGIMGMYYAHHDGEDESVARAIEAHYHPRFANDTLPEDNIGSAVSLADKLDTLTGIYGIGLGPTGDKDPFGLRRAALGVLRILIEKSLPLDLKHLLQLARSKYSNDNVAESVAVDLHGFILERLRNYLKDRSFEATAIDSIISQQPTRIDLVLPRLEAVRAFLEMPEAASLAAANKRIRNILKKSDIAQHEPDASLMQENAERQLHAKVQELSPKVTSLVDNEDYTDALRLLSGAKAAVDGFFDEVMVMTDEVIIRNNRLALLAKLDALMNRVADISKLAT